MQTLPFSKIRNAVLILSILFLVGGISYRYGQKHPETETQNVLRPVINISQPESSVNPVNFALFWDVWQRIHTYYIDAAHIDTQKLVWGAISGMVSALDDPYTMFLPPKENKDFKADIGGSFEGIGAQLDLREDRIIVVTPLKGTPAERAGLKPNDWIMKVDGKETVGWTLEDAVNNIRGERGTTVTLTIFHEKTLKPVDIPIVRDGIVVPSVEFWIMKGTDIKEISHSTSSARLSPEPVGYINLSRFGDRTNEEWQKAVDAVSKAWQTKSVKGLVLDMRNNPGGYLDGSVFIASEFIKSGLIVTQTNSDGTKQEYMVDRKGKLYDIPLVVLINKGSASASEIVAGALKDYKRATIVGETSFGKGSVQTPQELEGGASVHITTGKWLLPKGDWINKKGLTPDVLVPMNGSYDATGDAQLAKAIELLVK